MFNGGHLEKWPPSWSFRLPTGFLISAVPREYLCQIWCFHPEVNDYVPNLLHYITDWQLDHGYHWSRYWNKKGISWSPKATWKAWIIRTRFLFDYDRREWLRKIAFTFPVRLYQHHHGNYFGLFSFLWKIDVNVEDRGDKNLDAISTIREHLFTYSTCAIVKSFIVRYAKVNVPKPAIMRDVSHARLSWSAAETSAQAEVDELVAQFLLDSDAAALFYDPRRNYGRPKDNRLDPFWEALQKYLDNITSVQEMRHGDQNN